MSCFRRAWQNLNFDKEYLFGFETLVCNFRDLIYAQTACNTPKKKQNLKSHHMTLLQSNQQPRDRIKFLLSFFSSFLIGFTPMYVTIWQKRSVTTVLLWLQKTHQDKNTKIILNNGDSFSFVLNN